MTAVRRLAAGILAAATGVTLLAACGGSSSKSSKPDASSTTTTTRPRTYSVAPAAWKLPSPRTRAAVALDGTTAVLMGGQGSARTSIADITRVDVTSGTAKAGSPLKAKLHDAAGAALGTRVFFLGGGDATETANVELVSATGPSNIVGKLPKANADLGAASDGTAIFAIGGYDGKAVANTVLKSTDGVTWSPFATLVAGMRYPAVAVANGAIWVFGGSVNDVAMTTVQRIDLGTAAVTTPLQLPVALSASAAATVNGVIVLAGGRVNDKAVDTVWAFDPATNQITEVGKLPAPVSNHVMVATGDTAYVLGGEAGKVPTAAVSTIRVS